MTSSQDQAKQRVADFAMQMVAPELHPDHPIGVGTGSTTDFFIDALGRYRDRVKGAVASSERSAERLSRHGIAVLDLNDIEYLPLYVDGADELTTNRVLLKGGGGALTREKIVSSVARRFLCIADESKLVPQLGSFPLPVEIIPMARRYVTGQLLAICGSGARIRQRQDVSGKPYRTDNGNLILDIEGLKIEEPERLEASIDAIVGVVSNGLFALRRADVVLLGSAQGARILP